MIFFCFTVLCFFSLVRDIEQTRYIPKPKTVDGFMPINRKLIEMVVKQ